MKQDDLIRGVLIEKSHSLTLEEFCGAIHTSPEIIIEMVEYKLLLPEGETQDKWRFDSFSLRRGRIALSFYYELEINWEGIALAVELLEEIEQLRQQVALLKMQTSTDFR